MSSSCPVEWQLHSTCSSGQGLGVILDSFSFSNPLHPIHLGIMQSLALKCIQILTTSCQFTTSFIQATTIFYPDYYYRFPTVFSLSTFTLLLNSLCPQSIQSDPSKMKVRSLYSYAPRTSHPIQSQSQNLYFSFKTL